MTSTFRFFAFTFAGHGIYCRRRSVRFGRPRVRISANFRFNLDGVDANEEQLVEWQIQLCTKSISCLIVLFSVFAVFQIQIRNANEFNRDAHTLTRHNSSANTL